MGNQGHKQLPPSSERIQEATIDINSEEEEDLYEENSYSAFFQAFVHYAYYPFLVIMDPLLPSNYWKKSLISLGIFLTISAFAMYREEK